MNRHTVMSASLKAHTGTIIKFELDIDRIARLNLFFLIELRER